jgi:F5/8 type C domain
VQGAYRVEYSKSAPFRFAEETLNLCSVRCKRLGVRKLGLFLLVSIAALGQAAEVALTSFATATASSEETWRNNLAKHALDGNPNTRWCSMHSVKDSWLQLDFGSPCWVTQVEIVWELPEYTYRYSLEASLDGQKWTPLPGGKEASAKGGKKQDFARQRLQQLRITHHNPTTNVWSSIREVSVLGLPE